MVDGITEKQKEVVDYILNKIKDDGLRPGEKLDTEISIAKSIGITRATVREATRILVEQQRIYRVKGSGIFVGSTEMVARRTDIMCFHLLIIRRKEMVIKV